MVQYSACVCWYWYRLLLIPCCAAFSTLFGVRVCHCFSGWAYQHLSIYLKGSPLYYTVWDMYISPIDFFPSLPVNTENFTFKGSLQHILNRLTISRAFLKGFSNVFFLILPGLLTIRNQDSHTKQRIDSQKFDIRISTTNGWITFCRLRSEWSVNKRSRVNDTQL